MPSKFRPKVIVDVDIANTSADTATRKVNKALFLELTGGNYSVKGFIERTLRPAFTACYESGIVDWAVKVTLPFGHLTTDDPTGNSYFALQAGNIAKLDSSLSWMYNEFSNWYNHLLSSYERQHLIFFLGGAKTYGNITYPEQEYTMQLALEDLFKVRKSGIIFDSGANVTGNALLWQQKAIEPWVARDRVVGFEGSGLISALPKDAWWHVEYGAVASNLTQIQAEQAAGRLCISDCGMGQAVADALVNIQLARGYGMSVMVTINDLDDFAALGYDVADFERMGP